MAKYDKRGQLEPEHYKRYNYGNVPLEEPEPVVPVGVSLAIIAYACGFYEECDAFGVLLLSSITYCIFFRNSDLGYISCAISATCLMSILMLFGMSGVGACIVLGVVGVVAYFN